MNERPVPLAAMEDPNSVEMLRVWIAAKGLHCSMKIGMYKESAKSPEQEAWGKILADVARHIANAMEEGFGEPADASVTRIRESFLSELDSPSSPAHGKFANK